MVRVETENALVRALVGIHEIGAGAAVDVQVDESRCDDPLDALCLGRRTRRPLDLEHAVADRHQHVRLDRATENPPPVDPHETHRLFFPSPVGRPPVAPGMLVSNPATASLAMIASAIASFASLSM